MTTITDIEEDRNARELWWIYSPMIRLPWAGLRIATFFKAANSGELLLIIHNEMGDRVGIRVWKDIRVSELWYKVGKIEPPTMADILAASLTDIE